MSGIIALDVYVPRHRLHRSAIASALGTRATRGARAVASYDEDTTTLAVEAARDLLADRAPSALLFVTGDPVYLDKSNATVVHAGLGLSSTITAHDMHGSGRAVVGALRAALDAGSAGRDVVLVTSDIRTGRPGSTDETAGGDAAAAVYVSADEEPVARLLGAGSATEEFLDRWREPGQRWSQVWEERFGESIYVPLGRSAVDRALADAGLTIDDVDHLVVAGPHERAVRSLKRLHGLRSDADVADRMTGTVGNAGGTGLLLELADVLDRAAADAVVLVVALADGADALVLRTTDRVAAARPVAPVAERVGRGTLAVDYPTFLSWRGMLDREPPRRPSPVKPSAPSSARTSAWKFSFTGSRCLECEAVHLPPSRVCQQCHAVDRMDELRLADRRASVATFTVDHLAFSPSPPFLAAVLDFDGGGRFPAELTDVDADAITIGARFEMTFRCLYEADGVRNYFWKGRPVLDAEEVA
ncbi:OB-fold domain-containing protein [Nocardioides sediminis]|uniref:OB-fold domain-containing protein n=1 Tax=Nocardioides sediminis TaxID=433648 RepID=UPI000D30BD96|nr:OB-fold domain-containing protein [Nocardioides sediminis]